MAMVLGPFQVSVVSIDVGGNRSMQTFELAADITTYAGAETAMNALVTELIPVTNSFIGEAFITGKYANDTGGPYGTGQNETRAIVVCLLDHDPEKLANYTIINPTNGIFTATSGPGNNVVDIADADLLALLELFTTTDGSFTLSDGETLADASFVRSGKRIHRKSRNG